MSDSDSYVSKLNGSSGFISFEESRSECWSSETSVDYSAQNKKNNRRLVKRRNNKLSQNALKTENHSNFMSSRGHPDGEETPNSKQTQETPTNTRNYGYTSAGEKITFSDESLRIAAYYKSVGDFWNVFPKTDYVYSKHSKWYGTEVAPGIPRIPNMSRPTYRGRYSTTSSSLSSRLLESTEHREVEETWYTRIRRRIIVTTIVTMFVKVAQVAASCANVSSVASATRSAASATRSAASATSSVASAIRSFAATTSSVISSATAKVFRIPFATSPRSHQDGERPTANLWTLIPLLLLLLLPCSLCVYVAYNGNVPPPPNHVPAFMEEWLQDSLPWYLEQLCSPFASIWSGATWFTSLFFKTLMLLPTLLLETCSAIYGFLQQSATSSFEPSSVPRDPPSTTPGPSISLEDLENIKLVSSRLNDLMEKLAVNHKSDSQTDMLDALTMLLTMIEDPGVQARIEAVGRGEERLQLYLEKMKNLEGQYQENLIKLQSKLKMLELDSGKKQVQVSESSKLSPGIREEIMDIVHRLLEEYHADRTGKPDYALSSNGASIASIRCTRPFNKGSAEYVLLGFLHWEHMNTPDIIIKPGSMPGECWAFEGANGYVAIQLSMPIYVSGFSLEHTPKELTPMGHIESAPRKFSVWGLSSLEDKEEEFFGRFEFEDNGKSLQSFDAIVIDKPFRLVELRIESNHGHLEYTCLYRFRVHGRPAI